jgi:hypothetical protein
MEPASAARRATYRKLAASSVRILLASIAGIALMIGAALGYCVAMPGSSFQSMPPALTASEIELSQKLRAHVHKLSVEIGPRRAVQGDSLHVAERYIRDQLAAAAPRGRLRREGLGQAQGDPANVVLDLPGTVTAPLIIVGAHYDTAPGGTPGANDNASGAAAALVLASRFAKARHVLPIRVVLFANEEPPYYRTVAMGSLQHAAGCRQRNEAVRAMLSLETMGYYSEQPGSQQYPAPLDLVYPDRGNFIAFVGDLGSRSLVREVIGEFRTTASIPSEGAALPDALPGIGWSDHWSFWQHGYSAVMVTDTATFRDPNYHETSDVIENLDFERLARVVSGLEQTVLSLAAK